MNINEFSQLATSHLCENVCLLNKLNLSFRFRVWRRNSSLFPPNQYFFEGKGATLHSAPYFFEPGNQYFFELDNISPGFFVIGPRSHHYLLNLHNLIETLRMTQELVFCRFDTSSKLTMWNGWKSVNQHQIWVKYNEILSELTREAWICHQVQQCCNTESLITSCSFCLFLASPDALEVIVVTHSLTYSWLADLTDVTLESDDTYWRLDWCYSSNWGYWWGWWRRWGRLDSCDPGEWWYLLETWLMLL